MTICMFSCSHRFKGDLVPLLLVDGVEVAALVVGRGQLHALAGELRVEVSRVDVAHNLRLERGRDSLLLQVRPIYTLEEWMCLHHPEIHYTLLLYFIIFSHS